MQRQTSKDSGNPPSPISLEPGYVQAGSPLSEIYEDDTNSLSTEIELHGLNESNQLETTNSQKNLIVQVGMAIFQNSPPNLADKNLAKGPNQIKLNEDYVKVCHSPEQPHNTGENGEIGENDSSSSSDQSDSNTVMKAVVEAECKILDSGYQESPVSDIRSSRSNSESSVTDVKRETSDTGDYTKVTEAKPSPFGEETNPKSRFSPLLGVIPTPRSSSEMNLNEMEDDQRKVSTVQHSESRPASFPFKVPDAPSYIKYSHSYSVSIQCETDQANDNFSSDHSNNFPGRDASSSEANHVHIIPKPIETDSSIDFNETQSSSLHENQTNKTSNLSSSVNEQNTPYVTAGINTNVAQNTSDMSIDNSPNTTYVPSDTTEADLPLRFLQTNNLGYVDSTDLKNGRINPKPSQVLTNGSKSQVGNPGYVTESEIGSLVGKAGKGVIHPEGRAVSANTGPVPINQPTFSLANTGYVSYVDSLKPISTNSALNNSNMNSSPSFTPSNVTSLPVQSTDYVPVSALTRKNLKQTETRNENMEMNAANIQDKNGYVTEKDMQDIMQAFSPAQQQVVTGYISEDDLKRINTCISAKQKLDTTHETNDENFRARQNSGSDSGHSSLEHEDIVDMESENEPSPTAYSSGYVPHSLLEQT